MNCKKNQLFILLFSIAFVNHLSAQNGNDHWLGTGYRLDWNKGVPTASKWDSSGHQAVGLDTNGNLLWYANLYGVFDRRGVRMPNSPVYADSVPPNDYDGFNDFTFVVLPFPDSINKFALIVRAGAQEPQISDGKYLHQRTPPGFLMLDMSRNSGYGDVVNQTYIPLMPDTLAIYGLGITRHSNSKDYWIVSSGYAAYSNFTTGMKYYVSTQLSSSGLVQRKLFPSFVTGYISNFVFNNRGSMFLDDLEVYGSRLYYFNNSSGDITHYKDLIKANVFNYAATGQKARTVFTLNDSFLLFYSSSAIKKYFYGKTPLPTDKDIGIYAIPVFEIPDSNNIQRIDNNNIFFRWYDSANGPDLGSWFINDFQYGPDGKLYIFHFKGIPQTVTAKGYYYVSVIHHPEKTGREMELETNILAKPIPNFKGNTYPQNMASYFTFRINQGPYARFEMDTQGCVARFINTCPAVFDKFAWYWGDGDSAITGSRAPLVHTYSSSDTFLIRLHATGPNHASAWTWYRAIVKQKPRARFGVTTYTGCQYVGFAINDSTRMAGTGKLPYAWHFYFGDGKDTFIKAASVTDIRHNYFSSGNYNITLVANNGMCADTYALSKSVNIQPAARPGITTVAGSVCAGNTISMGRRYTDFADSIHWGLADTVIHSRTPNTAILYKTKTAGNVKIRQTIYSNACTTMDSVVVRVLASFADTAKPAMVQVTANDNKTLLVTTRSIHGAKAYQYLKNGIPMGTTRDTFFVNTLAADWADSNSYSVVATDSCGKQSLPSAAYPNILLASGWQGDTLVLAWNEYKVQKPLRYLIYTATDPQHFTLTDSTTRRQYKIPMANTPPASYYYKVAARTSAGGNAYSNYAGTEILPRCYLPTSFTPNADGLNDTWQPRLYGIVQAKYKIYNRAGLLLYTGQCPGPGWDGTYKGSPCNDGVYLAVISLPGSPTLCKTFTIIR